MTYISLLAAIRSNQMRANDIADALQVLADTGIVYHLGTTGGSGNAYTATPSPDISAAVAGQVFTFIANHTNSAAATINITGIGSVPLRTRVGVVLLANTIISGAMYIGVYDGSFIRILAPNVYSPQVISGSGVITNATTGFVNVTDTSIAITTTPGEIIKYSGHANISANDGGTIGCAVQAADGSTALANTTHSFTFDSGRTDGRAGQYSISGIFIATSTSHTLRLRFRAFSGSTAYIDTRSFMLDRG